MFPFTLALRFLKVIAPDAALTPGGLPPCGLYAVGPCAGDGSSLKERLEALPGIGRISISGIRSDGEAVEEGAVVCGVDGVSVIINSVFHGSPPRPP